MNHLDLFSGIGGFALPTRWMGWQTVQFVEIDSFCQKVLNKNFPNIPIHGDIKTFNGEQYRGTIDILTGGFPCQPFSVAGLKKGKDDSRFLWPEMLRVIGEVQPTYIVGENVYGLLNWLRGLVFNEVQTDLENIGYEVTPFVLPAAGVNAPHKRDRVWFIAFNPNSPTNGRRFARTSKGTWLELVRNQLDTIRQNKGSDNAESSGFNVTNSKSNGNRGRLFCMAAAYEGFRKPEKHWKNDLQFRDNGTEWNVANSGSEGLQRSEDYRGVSQIRKNSHKSITGSLRPDWKSFPTKPGVCGGNDGIPNRVDRIKSLGNSVVPQVVFEIFKAIELTYEATKQKD